MWYHFFLKFVNNRKLTSPSIVPQVQNVSPQRQLKFKDINDQTYIEVAKMLGISDSQISVENFSLHTVRAINRLLQHGINSNDAYQMVSGLDRYQSASIALFQLSKEQVCTPNYGEHTLKAIYKDYCSIYPDNLKAAYTIPEAKGYINQIYERYKGLSEIEILTIRDLNMTRREFDFIGSEVVLEILEDLAPQQTKLAFSGK